MRAFPHLLELNNEYADKGLVIVAMHSSNGFDQQKAMAALTSAGAPWVSGVDNGQTSGAYGVRGIPNSVLVGADGLVKWQGHPASLTNALIETELASVVSGPSNLFESLNPSDFPRKLQGDVEDLIDGDMSGLKAIIALANDEDLDGDMATALEQLLPLVRQMADRDWASIQSLDAEGFYYEASEQLEGFEDNFGKLDDWSTKIDEYADSLKEDEKKDGIKVGKQFAKAMDYAADRRYDKARKTLEDIVEDNPDSPYAARAAEELARLPR